MIGYSVGAAVLVAVPFAYSAVKSSLASKVSKVEDDLKTAAGKVESAVKAVEEKRP